MLSHPKFHRKNIIYIIEILFNNGYPLKFIFNIINHRLLYLLRKSTINNLETEIETPTYFTVPFLPTLTNNLKYVLKDTNYILLCHIIVSTNLTQN